MRPAYAIGTREGNGISEVRCGGGGGGGSSCGGGGCDEVSPKSPAAAEDLGRLIALFLQQGDLAM